MAERRTRTISTAMLARVEGEGGMHVKIRDGKVREVRLNIYEPPRFFEAFLRGRGFREVPDITARICGICPVAYQTSSMLAMEQACGVHVEGPLRDLRRMLYCGEWIESHALHVFMLHAPDFLGYESGIAMAADHGDVVAQALELKKIGNRLMTVVGGREVHPINVRVGGWYRAPRREELTALVPDLERAREIALAAVKLVAGFDFPDYERDYELVCLRHPGEYPIDRGRIVSNRGLDIPVEEYPEHFVEEHVAWSTALHSSVRERGAYLCGPLARFALNAEELSPLAREAARDAGLEPSERNPFRSILVRCVELVYAADEALRLIAAYEQPELPALDLQPRAGTGHGCTEAPRGILYHRYRLDAEGTVEDARLVPPTAQNQGVIEEDIRQVATAGLDLEEAALQANCEQSIRNHDPCISCAAHFIKLNVDRA
jgi:coenzyme F420-reducing hydrogenase alpha subunit